ncbi:hypothetical protein [Laribacter hongkongensis]|uniref:hypothetical protein n=1 Tax=Laribacter hongkongensis TaxID=168471 RepID=UPI001EFC904F|nr:hypothetical protein [Laribacter hongkongensis]MCG9094457.1 hypothetical protein [Laribacter hongkongensis]
MQQRHHQQIKESVQREIVVQSKKIRALFLLPAVFSVVALVNGCAEENGGQPTKKIVQQPPQPPISHEVESMEEIEVENEIYQFPFNPKEYAIQIADAATKITNKKSKPPKIKIDKSSIANSFEIHVIPDVLVVGFINNETGKMNKASIIIDDAASDSNALLGIEILMMSLSPDSTDTERNYGFQSLTSGNKSAMVGDVRYTAHQNGSSLVINAEPAYPERP